MPDIPQELRRRIALARSKALGEEAADIPVTSVDDLEPQAIPEGVAPPVLGSTEIPSGLLDRVKDAREKAVGSLEPAPERNAVPKENVERITPERIPIAVPEPTPVEASVPAAPAPAVPAEETAPAAAPAVAVGMTLEQAAEALGMPEKLLRRSVDAKARATGVSFDEALAGMLGDAAPAATTPAPTTAAEPVVEAPAAEPLVEAPAPSAPVTPTPETAAPATAGMSIEQAAEAFGFPEDLFRKSVEAKAKALGVSVDEALAGMTGGVPAAAPAPVAAAAAELEPVPEAAPQVAAPAPVPAAPAAAAPATAGMSIEQAAEAFGFPEDLFRKSVEAKAKALGVSVDEALAGMTGGAPAAAPAPVAAATVPVAEPAPEPQEAAAASPTAPAAPAAVSVEEAAASLGMPEKLFRRSVEAKAKALGVSFDQALAEMVGAPAPPAATPPAPSAPAAPSGPAVPVSPAGVAVEAPAAVETPAAEAIQPSAAPAAETVESKQLYRIELVTALVSAVILTLLALAGPAPVFRQAGGAADPTKIPWYLVWVAQLLAWIPREVAGFFAPLLVVVGLFAVPFVDRNPSGKASSRKFAFALFGLFMVVLLVLTIIGLINRPGGFGWPWS